MPPIRYPLPTLAFLLILTLAAWRGERWSRPLRAALSARWTRLTEGPPFPHSAEPRVIAGPIVRKALLLHDDVSLSDKPGGRPSGSIRFRTFVHIYDVWPLEGPPESYRIGSRQTIGWAAPRDLLPWDTRLVVRMRGHRPAAGSEDDANDDAIGDTSSLPVLSWTSDTVEIALWEPGKAWRSLAKRERIRSADIIPDAWGVWLSREELLLLLRRANLTRRTEPAGMTRLRAILGRLVDDQPIRDDELDLAKRWLPAGIMERVPTESNFASDRLARINKTWRPEAEWSGISFRFVPLAALP